MREADSFGSSDWLASSFDIESDRMSCLVEVERGVVVWGAVRTGSVVARQAEVDTEFSILLRIESVSSWLRSTTK